MNLTRSNFKQCLPFITKTLSECHCYSLDFQMSGIQRNQSVKNSVLDSFQQRYTKTRSNIQTFLPLQFGLCGLTKSQRTYTASPFNFYIYPLVLNASQDRVFSFSSGSMQFLAKNSFDFNKFFYEGIQYVSREDRRLFQGQYRTDKLRKEWRERARVVTPDMKAFENLWKDKVLAWLKEDGQPEMTLPIKWVKGRSYWRMIEGIRKEHPNLTFYQGFDKDLPINREQLILSKKAPKGYVEKPPISQEEFNNDHLLMSNIIEQISASRKPVVVHNGFLDLMHVYRRFIGRLPPTVQQYKQRLHQIFPTIYDTKFLCATSIVLYTKLNKKTDLSSCYQGLKDEPQPEIVINPQCKEYSLNNSQTHEAGFDALLTGIVFIKGRHQIQCLSKRQGTDPISVLKYFKNRLPLGSLKTPFNLQSNEDNYKSNKSFYLQSIIPLPIKQSEIKAYFQQHFGRVSVFWTARYVFSFGVQFELKEAEDKFEQMVKTDQGVSLVKIGKAKFVAFDQDKYAEYLRGVTSWEDIEEIQKIEESGANGKEKTDSQKLQNS